MAINIQSLTRGYGPVKVLNSLDMCVNDGTIYGLLGPSGCGKTTLLNIVLGRLIPESGVVEVFGCEPASESSNVPGRDVGYMPQDLALYDDLTIEENLTFHGRLHGMSKIEIKDRIAWILEFLDLPEASRRANQLSGGQRRRVSLGIALLHQPRLLLLDEPTVGVDPELRAKIWDHLREIADDGTTVVITTHYIDEASKSDRVGMMRDGILLAEDDPQELMEQHDTNSLEDVFLTLCRREVKQ